MDNKEYFIKTNDPNTFYIRRKDGCELWSNDRKLHIFITKKSYFNSERNIQQEVLVAECWMLYIGGWERGDNTTTINSIDEYIKELDVSPYFTEAIKEYYEQKNHDERNNRL